MPKGLLEHVNINVADNRRTARLLAELCGWKVRWEGPSMGGGHTIHIGTDTQYIALYTAERVRGGYVKGLPLNHVALEVDDLDGAEEVVAEAGLKPFGHDQYEPGKRFYFFDWDGIEWEVASYE